MKKLSVIIPCFNEKKTIREIVRKVEGVTIPDWHIEIVLVDDFSTDGTREILKEYETRHTVLYHDKNQGKGSSVKTGVARATGEYLLIQDADLEYDPAEIPSLVTALGGRENRVVYGSRNMHHTEKRGEFLPRLGVWCMTREFNLLFGTHLTDIWTCYKLFPKSAGKYFSAGRFESELSFSAELIKHNFEIIEVPIFSYNPRAFSEGKKITYTDGLRGIATIFKSWLD